MASGDSLLTFKAQENEPSSSGNASLDTRNNHVVLEFDAASDESAVFSGVMPEHYADGGLNIDIFWMSDVSTSGNVIWAVALERHEAVVTDLDTNSFGTTVEGTGAAPGTSGMVRKTTIALADGAETDNIAAGESFRLSITRSADATDDDMVGDAQILKVHVREQ